MTTDPDMTAAELALGLLDGAERAAALRRVLADPAFAREVEEWRDRLARLFDDYPDVPAPDVETVVARLDRAATAAPPARRRWLRGAVAAAIGIAAVLAIWFAARPQPTPPEAPHRLMIASLTLTDKSRSLPALVDATRGEIRTADSPATPADKSAELWLIGSDGVPQAIGLLAANGPSRLQTPPTVQAALAHGATLAISIEPHGGSPTGKPTGPVIASGELRAS